MNKQRSFIVAGAAATLAATSFVRRYQRDARAARARVEAVDRKVVHRIPGARLVTHVRGGHLMLGRDTATRTALETFLATTSVWSAP